MKLFIQIKNGIPFQHPIFEDNFVQAFPDVDTDNLPSNFAQFLRVDMPVLGVYEVYDGTTYEWQEGVVTDVHSIRAMTAREIDVKQKDVKAYWAQTGFASWVFNEETCSFEAPTPYPTDGNIYQWDEATTSWQLLIQPALPE